MKSIFQEWKQSLQISKNICHAIDMFSILDWLVAFNTLSLWCGSAQKQWTIYRFYYLPLHIMIYMNHQRGLSLWGDFFRYPLYLFFKYILFNLLELHWLIKLISDYLQLSICWVIVSLLPNNFIDHFFF